ncbi:uncharacterized protein [Acropora muricata]|uniref:uncharacterized protein n=1 Tax=Acropora muricata TaxID=159855 RepID=UPI0034E5B705
MDNALFTSRPQANQQQNYGESDKRKTLNEIQMKGYERVEPVCNMASKTSSQETKVNSVVNKQPNVCDKDDKMSIVGKGTNFSEDVPETKTAVGLKYLFSDTEKVGYSANVIGGDQHTLKESHRIQSPSPSLVFLQSAENRAENSLPISLTSFPGQQPPGSPSSSCPRRVSITDTPNVTSSYPSGPTDTTVNLTDYNVTRTQKTSTDIDDHATRRGSQTRRSSVAASMLSSDVRDKRKKSSLGFTLIASLVKWKINTFHPPRKDGESIAKNAKHQEFMGRTADRIKTELPRPLLVSIQEEVYPIIQRTAQAYRSQLGAKHKLTVQATARLEELIEELKNPY